MSLFAYARSNAFVIFDLSYIALEPSFLITTRSVIPIFSNVVNLCEQYSHSLLRLIAVPSCTTLESRTLVSTFWHLGHFIYGVTGVGVKKYGMNIATILSTTNVTQIMINTLTRFECLILLFAIGKNTGGVTEAYKAFKYCLSVMFIGSNSCALRRDCFASSRIPSFNCTCDNDTR